jgi:hypothetical protein
VRCPLDLFVWRHSVDRLALCGRAFFRCMYKSLSDFIRECKIIPWNKLWTPVSQKILNSMCCLSEHQQSCGFHWQTKEVEVDPCLCQFFDWRFLALHLMMTLIPNHGDSPERTMIHLPWWRSGNQ